MSTQSQDVRTDFDWQPQPAAASLVARLLDRCIQANPHIANLQRRMALETGTRLVDWVDAIDVNDDDLHVRLMEAGFEPDSRESDCWRHPAGVFPTIRTTTELASGPSAAAAALALDIKAASADDFAASFGREEAAISGQPGSQLRICALPTVNGCALRAVERHGWKQFNAPANRAQQIAAAAKHRRTFDERRRDGGDESSLFAHAVDLFDAAAADLGRDWACDLFFAAERAYWMTRNAAGRRQFERQQRLGLGWGNHDHHTYRSSRECFASLIAALERMGFECRERFYAGREAGWGAQVLEQAECGVVIFADVDLAPDEVVSDFAHESLSQPDKLGTVGLWCKLHGEAFLSAGMHHLECQFDFDAARAQLAALGIESMTPFTHWAHLKQAFTRGEVWPVRPERIEASLQGGFITPAQAAQFRREGALGSHLEILERNDGFKGFNQTGISEIISRTDPRKWQGAH